MVSLASMYFDNPGAEQTLTVPASTRFPEIHMLSRRVFIAASAASALMATTSTAYAAEFPSRAVTLVVPYAAGGPTDQLAREMANYFTQDFKQPVVVDNRPGGGAQVAINVLKQAPADGHTIFFGDVPSLATNPGLFAKLSYDPHKDLVPVSQLIVAPGLFVVPTNSPFKTLADLVAYAKANPGKLSYATSGVGTSNHLAAELLQSVAGIRLTNVPYKGSSQIVPDLLSGTVMMSMESSLATTLQHINAGKLKAIAVTSPQRSRALPDVPTVAESGYPGFDVETWFGLIAPAGTPQAIVGKLQAAWQAGSNSQEAHTAFDNISGSLHVNTPQQFADFISAENLRWGELIRKLGIKAS